jgi:hypothetical protein
VGGWFTDSPMSSTAGNVLGWTPPAERYAITLSPCGAPPNMLRTTFEMFSDSACFASFFAC